MAKREIIYLAVRYGENELMKKRINKYCELLEKKGYSVLNPAMLPSGLKEIDYKLICQAMIDACDEVWFFANWIFDDDSIAERELCVYKGKKILEINEDNFIKIY